MARSWEYSAKRRVLMQALMWVVFLASLGVAGVLSNRKPAVAKITLASEPRSLGELLVHTPDKWHVTTEVVQGKRVMTMTERTEKEAPRVCIVSTQSMETGAMTARGYLLDATGESTDKISDFTFKNLGKGVEASALGDIEDNEEIPLPLCASIIIPRPNRPGESLGILVVFSASSANDATGYRWLQAIADGISLNAKAATLPGVKSN